MEENKYKKYHSLSPQKYAELCEFSLKIMAEEQRKAFIDRKKKIMPVPFKFKM